MFDDIEDAMPNRYTSLSESTTNIESAIYNCDDSKRNWGRPPAPASCPDSPRVWLDCAKERARERGRERAKVLAKL